MICSKWFNQENAVFPLMAVFAAFAAATAQALPQPTAANFSLGAQFTVAGYDSSKPALADFPVLVRIGDNSPSGFQYSQLQSPADGADLCFVDISGNGLPFEIDTWNTNGESLVWVRLPQMSQGAKFYMCWGSATSGKTVCSTNPFDGYKGVWHMNEANAADASGNGNGGTTSGAPSVSPSGKVGSALSLATTSDYVTCGTNQPNSELTDAFTVEAWVNPASYSGTRCIFGKNAFISIRTESQSAITVTTPGKSDHKFTGLSLPAAQTWWHVALTFQRGASNGCKIYVDGALAGQQQAGDINDKTNPTEMWLGKNQWGQNYTGLLDEMRLSADIKSAEWIAASCAAQSDPASFLTAGTAESLEATAAPSVGVAATDVQYTNATLSVAITSLGQDAAMTADASWADATLIVAADASFSNPLFTIPLARANEAPVEYSVAVQPLATNYIYYAKVSAANEFGVAAESSVASFMTETPGAPAGTAAVVSRGFTTIDASVAATAFGAGAESATARLEASTDGFETVCAAGMEAAAAIGTPVQLQVEGLAADAEYSLRIVIRNNWGVEASIPLPVSRTRDVPFSAAGIGWTFSQDGSEIDITFEVSEMFDGATASASLTYAGQSRGTFGVSSAETLVWTALPVAPGSAAATVVLSATLDGQTYSQTYSATIAAGSTAVSVADITEHMSVATSVRVSPGDVVTLPELEGTDEYILGNRLFASLEGNVLTALRPGILGVHHVTESGATTNTLAVIVLPEKIGDGEIYIFDETAHSGTANWNDKSFWETLGSGSRDSYPCRTNDIAIIPFYATTNGRSINLAGDICLGALFFGGIQDSAISVNLGTNNSNYKRKVTFVRTDGKPALLQCCGSGSAKERRTLLTFNGTQIAEYTGDATISGGWDGRDTFVAQGRVNFNGARNIIPEGATVTFVEFDPQDTSNNQTLSAGRLLGGGTLWNRSAANIKISGTSALAEFTGVLRDSSCGNLGTDRSGPIFVRTPSATNTLYELVGLVATNSSAYPIPDSSRSVGRFFTGWEPYYGGTDYGEENWFPARGLVMHGGTHYARATEKSGSAVWGVGTRERKVGAKLSVTNGFNLIHETERQTSQGHPINWLEYNSIEHGNKATLRITDPSRYALASTADHTNTVTILHDVSSFFAGQAGNPESTASYPIVPWIAGPVQSKNPDSNLMFACFGADDRYVKPGVSSNLISSWSDTDNAVVQSSDISLGYDKTLNSLALDNSSSGKRIGQSRTLTLTSGGLIFSNAKAAIGTEDGGVGNGSLVLGDATHPGYVWAIGTSESSQNQIWASVTAPGGFVAAYTGFLTLGGDQTGIGDEIAVNAGTLTLGTAESACTLARDLPVRICAGATLLLPNGGSTSGTVVKFDASAGHFGKVKVPEGVAASCRRVYWRDYPETLEWQSIPRGVYTGDESTALATGATYDPAHFIGAGTLEVRNDNTSQPFFMILR